MELKYMKDYITGMQDWTFNRTAYGIETQYHLSFVRFSNSFNRTAYGIETEQHQEYQFRYVHF